MKMPEMRLTPDELHRQLVQVHDEQNEMYFIRLAVLFEQNGADMIDTFNKARTAGWNKDDARTIVLTNIRVIPYEAFLTFYVLSGDTKFRLHGTTAVDFAAGCVPALASLKTTPAETGDGSVSIVPSSAEKTD